MERADCCHFECIKKTGLPHARSPVLREFNELNESLRLGAYFGSSSFRS
jgi:hypothetical protein